MSDLWSSLRLRRKNKVTLTRIVDSNGSALPFTGVIRITALLLPYHSLLRRLIGIDRFLVAVNQIRVELMIWARGTAVVEQGMKTRERGLRWQWWWGLASHLELETASAAAAAAAAPRGAYLLLPFPTLPPAGDLPRPFLFGARTAPVDFVVVLSMDGVVLALSGDAANEFWLPLLLSRRPRPFLRSLLEVVSLGSELVDNLGPSDKNKQKNRWKPRRKLTENIFVSSRQFDMWTLKFESRERTRRKHVLLLLAHGSKHSFYFWWANDPFWSIEYRNFSRCKSASRDSKEAWVLKFEAQILECGKEIVEGCAETSWMKGFTSSPYKPVCNKGNRLESILQRNFPLNWRLFNAPEGMMFQDWLPSLFVVMALLAAAAAAAAVVPRTRITGFG